MAIRVFAAFGTRPEAVKMAPVIKLLSANPDFEVITGVTGQHREMLDQVLALFSIEPRYDLKIMRERQELPSTFVLAFSGLSDILKAEKPDIVLVHGDALTAFAGSLAAFFNKIPVGHVEAGLRTNDKYLPYPEEMNRRLAGVLADLHFAPTQAAKENLLREGISPQAVFVTGNTVIDALKTTIWQNYEFKHPLLRNNVYEGRTILVEVHRRENWGAPMEEMCQALLDILHLFPDCSIIFPVHLNPAVRDVVMPRLEGQERVTLLDPLDTDDFHNLMARSDLILTDSGGLQEEAPSLGVPVLVMRENTERPEAVAAGTVKVVGTHRANIVAAASQLLGNREAYDSMATAANPYGDGRASQRIEQALLYHFRKKHHRPQEWDS
jgi:UDP-N-acetylglucosamine 2-epimerase (non-hydrolysing)